MLYGHGVKLAIKKNIKLPSKIVQYEFNQDPETFNELSEKLLGKLQTIPTFQRFWKAFQP